MQNFAPWRWEQPQNLTADGEIWFAYDADCIMRTMLGVKTNGR
jgi:hypothetical protein